MSASRTPRGFSIMEILVAAALLGLMGSLMWSAFSNTLDSKERIEAASDRVDEIRVAMNRMAQEISYAFISNHYAREDRRTRTIFKEGGTGIGDHLTFSAFAHEPLVAHVNESDQTVISYFVDTDPDGSGKNVLLRRYKRRIDADPDTEEDTVTETLCTDVSDLLFDYWNDATGEWKDAWDTEGIDTPNVLPKRVMITMSYKDENGKETKLVTQAPILLWQTLNF
ncbi:MAG: general secretion pathway protein GspJ [Deltaproteobacteria bacterium]|nr:general secretion pathway protein GspJ [Deltaproteobacteria bacterium]